MCSSYAEIIQWHSRRYNTVVKDVEGDMQMKKVDLSCHGITLKDLKTIIDNLMGFVSQYLTKWQPYLFLINTAFNMTLIQPYHHFNHISTYPSMSNILLWY